MAEYFKPEYEWVWTLTLALALFVPVRHFIWVMAVRRVERQSGEELEEAARDALKSRAAVTSALLCAVFSYFYMGYLFSAQT